MKVGANPTHDAYVASWKDRVPADQYMMAENTPIMKSLKCAFDEFHKYAGEDGVAKGEEVDKFMQANFIEIIKNPKHPETVKKLVAAVDALKDNGINVEQFAELYCGLVKAFAKDEVGVADKPHTEAQ
ncbi:unnamed protein product [Ranitomeya imitator]|uniref:Myoglobin n=1 Tax=Ranitomeya imitator TaxID=111125 RepID=A0ABN9LL77_9NEOB|nr:unnamed protein product [Ranitomeya imitator]